MGQKRLEILLFVRYFDNEKFYDLYIIIDYRYGFIS